MTERQKVTALSSRSRDPAPVAVWKLVGIAVLIFLVLVSGISITLNRLQRKPVLGVVQAQAPETTALAVPVTIRSFPDTTEEKIYYEASPSGGGIVPADGDISDWRMDYVPVTTLRLLPNQGAVLLAEAPER